MSRHAPHQPPRNRHARGAFQILARAANGTARLERFDDVASYRAHLARLQPSNARSVTIDDIVAWLDSASTPRTRIRRGEE
jgi:hypothetical protein